MITADRSATCWLRSAISWHCISRISGCAIRIGSYHAFANCRNACCPRPHGCPAGYDIAHAWRPQRSVSGDYFDVIELDAGKFAVCIGDVIGKGMPAALLMSNVQAAVKAVASHEMPPAEVCSRVNRVLSGNLAEGNFVTLFYSIDRQRHRRANVH